MKTRIILSTALLVLCTASSHAQSTRPHLRETGGQLPQPAAAVQVSEGAPEVLVGTIGSAVTSRERVLAYPRLLPQSLSCEVTGFEFSLTTKGKPWGPVTVKGAAFNEEIKDKIKDTDPDNVKIYISNIRVKCGADEITAKPIDLEYNH